MKKETTLIIIALVMFAVCAFSGCSISVFEDYGGVIKANWDISIPKEAEYREVYSKDSGVSFHGDGIRYHVFSCKQTAPIDKMADWSNTQQETKYNSSYKDAVTGWLDSIEVPDDRLPDFSACTYFYKSEYDDELILLWNKQKGTLYVVECFI